MAIERRIAGADLVDRRYEDFDEGDLRTDKDERVQLGYRIARLAGVRVVHGIDEQPEGGEPDYFPYGNLVAYAGRSGKEAALDRVMAAGPRTTARFEAMQRTRSVGALLADWNDPANPVADQSIYYGMLGIGDTRAQPGADEGDDLVGGRLGGAGRDAEQVCLRGGHAVSLAARPAPGQPWRTRPPRASCRRELAPREIARTGARARGPAAARGPARPRDRVAALRLRCAVR